MDIKLSKTNIRKQTGAGWLSALLPVVRGALPTIGKTLGLSALAGLALEGASQIVKKKIGGKGQDGGFLIPQNKIDKLIANKHRLTEKQKWVVLNALQSGGRLGIRPTQRQLGSGLGTILASISISLAVDLVGKLFKRGKLRRSTNW